jgi:hypothetical protein
MKEEIIEISITKSYTKADGKKNTGFRIYDELDALRWRYSDEQLLKMWEDAKPKLDIVPYHNLYKFGLMKVDYETRK